MTDVLLLYLFTRLDIVVRLFSLVCVVAFVAFCVATFVRLVARNEMASAQAMLDESPAPFERDHRRALAQHKNTHQLARRFSTCAGVVFALSLLVAVAVPSKQDFAIIVGGKIALDVGRSETAQEVGQEVLDAIRAQLKKASE